MYPFVLKRGSIKCFQAIWRLPDGLDRIKVRIKEMDEWFFVVVVVVIYFSVPYIVSVFYYLF